MRWHLCSMGRKWRLYWGKLAPLWVFAFSQILCIYVALHFFLTSLMKVNIYDEVFEENKYVQKDTLPTKCGILLWRLERNYSWRSLMRDVALAVAETGSSWCVYSCTLKSVGTDFWGRDNWASFFTTFKSASRLSEHATSAAVVENWVNWLQTRASF